MASEPFYLNTPYYEPFVLDKAKLTRIVGIVMDRLPGIELLITPVLSNLTHVHLTSLEDLFAMDNAPSNPITELRLVFHVPKPKKKAVEIVFRGGRNCRVSLALGSLVSSVAMRLSAELQEQLERTFVRDWANRVRRYATPLTMIVVSIMMLTLGLTMGQSREQLLQAVTPRFSDEERSRLLTEIQVADTTERKLDVLLHIEAIRLADKPVRTEESGLGARLFSRRILLVAIPLLVVVGVAGYMFFFLYPSGVFVWGDFEEHYQKIVERRRFCFGVVIVGVLVNLLAGALWVGLST